MIECESWVDGNGVWNLEFVGNWYIEIKVLDKGNEIRIWYQNLGIIAGSTDILFRHKNDNLHTLKIFNDEGDSIRSIITLCTFS